MEAEDPKEDDLKDPHQVAALKEDHQAEDDQKEEDPKEVQVDVGPKVEGPNKATKKVQ